MRNPRPLRIKPTRFRFHVHAFGAMLSYIVNPAGTSHLAVVGVAPF